METLNELGVKHGTDKSSITHFYLNNYENYFNTLRDKSITLLELGIASGASLRMWQEYFSQGKIYGVDINPDCAQHPGAFIGSQTDSAFLQGVIDQIGIPDIIIDDGSHYGPDMIATFKDLFPKMKPGGIYAVEDFHCAYDPTYGLAPPYGQGMSEVYNFFTNLAIDVDVYGRHMTGNADYAINTPKETPPVPEYSRILESMHIHPSIRIFIRK